MRMLGLMSIHLASVLYELLTGDLPFRGEQRMLIVKILRDEPTNPRTLVLSLPKDLETICLRCLEKDPQKRPQSAAILSEELQRFLVGEPIKSRPVSPVEKATKWCRRNASTVRWVAVVTTILFAAASALSAIRYQNLRAIHAAEREKYTRSS